MRKTLVFLASGIMLLMFAFVSCDSKSANTTEISSKKVKVTFAAPPPPYPAMAARAKIQGKVVVEITLGADGIPLSVKSISGHAVLHDYAVNWAKKWKFKADLEDGQTVTFKHTLDCKLP